MLVFFPRLPFATSALRRIQAEGAPELVHPVLHGEDGLGQGSQASHEHHGRSQRVTLSPPSHLRRNQSLLQPRRIVVDGTFRVFVSSV